MAVLTTWALGTDMDVDTGVYLKSGRAIFAIHYLKQSLVWIFKLLKQIFTSKLFHRIYNFYQSFSLNCFWENGNREISKMATFEYFLTFSFYARGFKVNPIKQLWHCFELVWAKYSSELVSISPTQNLFTSLVLHSRKPVESWSPQSQSGPSPCIPSNNIDHFETSNELVLWGELVFCPVNATHCPHLPI